MGMQVTGNTGSTAVDLSHYEVFHDVIKLVRGDTLPQLNLTLRDSNTAAEGKTLDQNDPTTWAPMDLTGATVKLKFRAKGSSTVKEELSMYANGDPVNGKVFMAWGTNTLDTAGEFTGEVEITYSNGDISTVFKQLSFIVREDY